MRFLRTKFQPFKCLKMGMQKIVYADISYHFSVCAAQVEKSGPAKRPNTPIR